jgi:DNA end-binding protein Ku
LPFTPVSPRGRTCSGCRHVGTPYALPGDMAQSIWTGSIGFGLVQIPVSLHGAEERHELDMTLLDKSDLSPVGYKRFNKTTDREVQWEDIVKGYEHAKGEYVILTPADFEQANLKATKQVDISAFVDVSEIDVRYVERPYYLAPQKAGTKAYALLRETLRETGKAGIGKIVIRTRQHLAAVMAHDDALLLVLLRFSDELRDTSGLKLPDTSLSKLGVSDREVKMARQLVEALVEPFEPEKFTDDYRQDILQLVEQKVEAGEVNALPSESQPKAKVRRSKPIDLAALLAQSVEGLGDALRKSAPANENAGAEGKTARNTVRKAKPRAKKATTRAGKRSSRASSDKRSDSDRPAARRAGGAK